MCLYCRAQLLTFSDHPTASLIRDCWQERYPEGTHFCTFNMRTKCFFNNRNINIAKNVIPHIPTWLIKKPIVNYDMFHNCRKNDYPTSIKSCFLNIISNDYHDFTVLYTDGSKSYLDTSSALYIPRPRTKEKTIYRFR